MTTGGYIPGRLQVGADGRVTGPATITYNHPFPCVNGTFGSGSASTTLCIEKGASANGPFFAVASISVPMMTAFPVYHDEVVRFRHNWTSAAAAITNASVDVWIA